MITFSELSDEEQRVYVENTAVWAAQARKARNERDKIVERVKDYTQMTRDEIDVKEGARVDVILEAQPTPQSIRDSLSERS